MKLLSIQAAFEAFAGLAAAWWAVPADWEKMATFWWLKSGFTRLILILWCVLVIFFWRDFRFTLESKSLSKMWVFEQQRMGWSDWFAKDATKKSEVASWTCGRKPWFFLRPWSYSCYLSLLLSILITRITTLKKMEKVQCITSVDSDFTKFSLFEASLMSQWFPSFSHLDRSLWDALFTHFGL